MNFGIGQLIIFTLFSGVLCRQSFGPGEEEWGHITVRDGAHMFYWLFYSQVQGKAPVDQPLVLWLEGGPGLDSTGYANFLGIGPYAMDGTIREHSWIQEANILFVDSPVGAGFSYVDYDNLFAASTPEVVEDLVSFMRGFFDLYPALGLPELYIFGHGFSSKIAVELGKQLHLVDDYVVNLKGITLMSPWISPVDAVASAPSYMLYAGLIDQKGFIGLEEESQNIQRLMDVGKWSKAAKAFGRMEENIFWLSYNIDAANGYSSRRMSRRSGQDTLAKNHVHYQDEGILQNLMEGVVRQKLGISKKISFGGQKDYAFEHLLSEFMKPTVATVEELLNHTSTKINVITNELDFLAVALNSIQWMDYLDWSENNQWLNTEREPIFPDSSVEGYRKTVGQLSLYWLNSELIAGDNPNSGLATFRLITSRNQTSPYAAVDYETLYYDDSYTK